MLIPYVIRNTYIHFLSQVPITDGIIKYRLFYKLDIFFLNVMYIYYFKKVKCTFSFAYTPRFNCLFQHSFAKLGY